VGRRTGGFNKRIGKIAGTTKRDRDINPLVSRMETSLGLTPV